MTVDTEVIRQMATSLRDTAEDVRDLGDRHMNEALGMQWVSASATAFTSRTVSDHIAVLDAAARIDELADALVAHADATDVAAAERAAAAALGAGPGRLAS